MRENEEALIKENEEAMRDAEASQEDPHAPLPGSIDDVDEKVNGIKTEDGSVTEDGEKATNGIGSVKSELAQQEGLGKKMTADLEEKMDALQHERKQVLSH